MNNKIFLQSPKPQNSFILSNSSVCVCAYSAARWDADLLSTPLTMAVILIFSSPTTYTKSICDYRTYNKESSTIYTLKYTHTQALDTLSHRSNTNKKPIKNCKNVWKYILNKYNLLLRSRATLLRLFQSNCAAGESSYAIGQVERQLSVWWNRFYEGWIPSRALYPYDTRSATGIAILYTYLHVHAYTINTAAMNRRTHTITLPYQFNSLSVFQIVVFYERKSLYFHMISGEYMESITSRVHVLYTCAAENTKLSNSIAELVYVSRRYT